jgi:threonine aldolase
MTWKSGVDILSLGATKNGALSCEMVVVFNKSLYANVDRRQKRAGHLLSKQKFIAAQIIKWIENDKWIKAAVKANNFAKKIENILKNNNKIKVIYPVESNMIFLELPLESELNLKKNNVEFYSWPSDNNTLRFVISWNFKNQEINVLKKLFAN